MLDYNQLRSGVVFINNGQPYEVLESNPLKMQQRRPVMQTRMRNLLTGAVLQQNFHQSEKFEEADIEKRKVKFLYANRGEFWFCQENDPSKRFTFKEELLGNKTKYLKPNMIVDALYWDEKYISVSMPVKMDLKVAEAAPGLKGDSATGSTKAVKLETGAYINVPLFINEEDIIRVNTETDEYVERIEKA